jgi:hypothetical protein
VTAPQRRLPVSASTTRLPEKNSTPRPNAHPAIVTNSSPPQALASHAVANNAGTWKNAYRTASSSRSSRSGGTFSFSACAPNAPKATPRKP